MNMTVWFSNIFLFESMLGNLESGKSRCPKQTSLIPLDPCSTHWETPYENHDSTLDLEESVFSFGKSCRKNLELKKFDVEADLLPETDYISQACDGYMVGEAGIRGKEIINHMSPWCVSSPLHVANTYGRKNDDLSSALGNILPAYNENIDSTSIVCGGSIDCLYFGDDRHIDEEHDISFLRSCSFGKSLMQERKSPSRDVTFEFGRDGYEAKRRRIDCCDITEDEINPVICGGDFQCSAVQPFQCSPLARHGIHGMSESPVRDPVKSSFLENTLLDSEKFWKSTSSWEPFRSGWSPLTMKETEVKFLDNDNYPIEKSLVEGHSRFGKDILHGRPTQEEVQYHKHGLEDTKYNWLQHDFSITNFPLDEEIGESQLDFENLFSIKLLKRFTDAYWSPSPFKGEKSLKNYSGASSYDTSRDECEHGRHNSRDQRTILNRKTSFSRSHSAPPYYKGERRFLDLTDNSSLSANKSPKNIFVGQSSTGLL